MTDPIKLKPFTKECVSQTYKWMNDDNLRDNFLLRGEMSWSSHVTYCERIMSDVTQNVYAIFYENNYIGNCGFKNIIKKIEGEFWIYIGAVTDRGKGIGHLVTQRMLQKGFGHCRFKIICLHVAAFNTAALVMYKNLGFVEAQLNESDDVWKDRNCKIIRMELKRRSEMVVAMMQPAFMPWLGFFELMYRSKRFILLDDFQFSVQSYHQRNRLFVNRGQVDWYSVPVKKNKSFKVPLNETLINDSIPWRKKQWKRIEQNYSKTPFFLMLKPRIKHWMMQAYPSLAAQNIEFIMLVCNLMGLEREIYYSSHYSSTTTRSHQVVELLRWCEADCYLCARGSFSYMSDDGVFPVKDIDVLFQNYVSKPYPQVGSPKVFIPSLSILDPLMNIGPEETLKLIENGTELWDTWEKMKLQPEVKNSRFKGSKTS